MNEEDKGNKPDPVLLARHLENVYRWMLEKQALEALAGPSTSLRKDSTAIRTDPTALMAEGSFVEVAA